MFNLTGKRFSALFGAALILAACGGGEEPSAPGSGARSTPSSGAERPSAPSPIEDNSSPSYFVENVGDRVFFATDKYNLDSADRAILRSQAEWLQQNSEIRLMIEGHADERGTREYNIALGARRASAVRNYLVRQGVAPDRLETISYGKERPVSLCSSERCWSKNRRTVSTVR